MNERLKELRKAFGLSQRAFAEKIGVPQSTYAHYELPGDNSPSAAVIAVICRTFSINEHWLRTGEGSTFNDDAHIALIKRAVDEVFDGDDDFKIRWLDLLLELSDEEWEILHRVASKLVESDRLQKEAEELLEM